MAIGYNYNYWKLLGLIANEGAGINYPIDPYLLHLPGNYSNVYICTVVHPNMIVSYSIHLMK